MPEPKSCKNFVPCSKCQHNQFCSKSASHSGYCGKSSQCVPLFQHTTFCITCVSFSDLDVYYLGYVDSINKPPKNPDAEERKRMLEFFFPKQKKPHNPDDPWEFL